MAYVPVAQGYNAYAGLAKETTFGTFVPATDFARINSESVKKDRTILMPPLLGGSRFQQVRVGGLEKVGGSVDFPVNVEDMVGFLLKDLLGSETANSLESGTAGSHLFVPYTTHGLAGLSMELSRDQAISNNVWKASGGHVGSLTFTYEPGGLVKCSADMIFQNIVSGGTPQSPTYGANARFVVAHTGTIGVPTSTAAILKAFNLKIDGGLGADRFALGSKLITEPSPGMYKISGSMQLAFSSITQVTNFLNDTAQSITIDLTCDSIGATVTGLKFVLGSIYLDGETPVASGPEELWLTLPFTSIHGTAATLLSATLVNSQATAY